MIFQPYMRLPFFPCLSMIPVLNITEHCLVISMHRHFQCYFWPHGTMVHSVLHWDTVWRPITVTWKLDVTWRKRKEKHLRKNTASSLWRPRQKLLPMLKRFVYYNSYSHIALICIVFWFYVLYYITFVLLWCNKWWTKDGWNTFEPDWLLCPGLRMASLAIVVKVRLNLWKLSNACMLVVMHLYYIYTVSQKMMETVFLSISSSGIDQFQWHSLE